MPRIIESDGEYLIFKDYQKRQVIIKHEDYLSLMMVEERQAIRPALEDCLADPTEVWWNVENINGKDYSYYKYIKLYSDFMFVATALLDDSMNFYLNNFYGFEKDEFVEAEKERRGQPILSRL